MTWLKALGGLGDTLIFSGVLKAIFDVRKETFNIVARPGHRDFYVGHPAVARYGIPPPGADVRAVLYSADDAHQTRGRRPFQALAHLLGLATPAEEVLYFPQRRFDERRLLDVLPRNRPRVAICPSSAAPHKEMSNEKWQALVAILNRADLCVVQIGRRNATHVRGAYDFRGLTTPGEAATLLRNFDAVVSVDSFLMHAAAMHGVPTVVLWGPTSWRIFGYDKHLNIESKRRRCEACRTAAIAGHADVHSITGARRQIELVYRLPCPLAEEERCMELFDVDEIAGAVFEVLARRDPARPR